MKALPSCEGSSGPGPDRWDVTGTSDRPSLGDPPLPDPPPHPSKRGDSRGRQGGPRLRLSFINHHGQPATALSTGARQARFELDVPINSREEISSGENTQAERPLGQVATFSPSGDSSEGDTQEGAWVLTQSQ